MDRCVEWRQTEWEKIEYFIILCSFGSKHYRQTCFASLFQLDFATNLPPKNQYNQSPPYLWRHVIMYSFFGLRLWTVHPIPMKCWWMVPGLRPTTRSALLKNGSMKWSLIFSWNFITRKINGLVSKSIETFISDFWTTELIAGNWPCT